MKQTDPLAKAIQTLEGQLTVLVSIVVAVCSAIDPHQLPPKVAAVVSTVLTVALILQRGVIKSTAVKGS